MVKTRKRTAPSLNFTRLALAPPNFKAVIWFCLLLTIYLCLSVSVEGFLTLLIFFIPLAMFGLFFSYHTGLTIAKTSRKLIIKRKSWVIFLKMIGIQALIVLLCLLIVGILYGGYPISPGCFDVCTPPRSLADVLLSFSIESTIGSLPAYYAIFRYLKWHKLTTPHQSAS